MAAFAPQQSGQGHRRQSHALFRQNVVQFFQRTFHAHPRGVFREPDFGSDFGVGTVFKMAEQHGLAFRFIQPVHGFIKQRTQLQPVRL